MKTFLFFSCLFLISIPNYSQQPNGYFPPGSIYTYNVFPLDSSNNPIVSEMFYRRDLFAEVANYKGKMANIFLTKTAQTIDSLDIKPYLDSLLYHFDGTDGYEYFQTRPLEGLLKSLDSMGLDPNFNFLSFFRSLQDWYSPYRFNATLNDEYTLLSVDTTVAGFNVRFEYLGERFADEMIPTDPYGPTDCKKFLISWRVSVFIINWIELLSTKDTIWIAPGTEFWMTQDFVPTNHIYIPLFNVDTWIFGFKTGDVVVPVENEFKSVIPIDIALEQNFPNPFNPSTSIRYKINNTQYVSLKVYDMIGNEVTTLVNEVKPAGYYNVKWNAIGFTSGVYFYQLKTESIVETKKMILMK